MLHLLSVRQYLVRLIDGTPAVVSSDTTGPDPCRDVAFAVLRATAAVSPQTDSLATPSVGTDRSPTVIRGSAAAAASSEAGGDVSGLSASFTLCVTDILVRAAENGRTDIVAVRLLLPSCIIFAYIMRPCRP